MFIISHTIGIVGTGNVIQEMARVAAGERMTTTGRPIPFEDVGRILFFDRDPSSGKIEAIIEKEFKHRMGKIEVASEPDFTTFYSESECVIFAPGDVLSAHYENSGAFFEQVYHALKADILRAAERFDRREAYERFYDVSELQDSPMHKLGFYMITLDLLERQIKQEEFFSAVYDGSPKCEFAKLEARVAGGKLHLSDSERLVFDTIVLALKMKKEGLLTYGYRLIDYLPFSLDIAVDYVKRIKERGHHAERDRKTILVVTNEPGQVCNIMSMIHPTITPYLIGVSDNDSRRVRKDIINHFRLTGLDPDSLDMGIVGDHDVYGRLVWGRNTLAQIEQVLGAPLSPKLIHDFFTKELYKVIARRIEDGENPNTELGESIIVLANAALKSKGSGARVVGEFYDSIFIGQEYSGFGVTKHGFMDRRAVPLEVVFPTIPGKNIAHEYLNGLEENKSFRKRLITKTGLGKSMTEAKGEPLPEDPHVESELTKKTEKKPSTSPFPNNLREEGVEILYSARKAVARLGYDEYGRLVVKAVYDINAAKGDECRAIASFEVHGRQHLCAADSSKLKIYDSECFGEAQNNPLVKLSFPEEAGCSIDFIGVARPDIRDKTGGKIGDVVNKNILDLEQIVLVNIKGRGLFGFSVYELAISGSVNVDGTMLTKDPDLGRCLAYDVTKEGAYFVYKLKGNRLFYAGISSNSNSGRKLVVGEYTLCYIQNPRLNTLGAPAQNAPQPELPALPYSASKGNYVQLLSVTRIVAELGKEHNESRFSGIEEKVLSFDVDTDDAGSSSNYTFYVGTNTGKIFMCDLASGKANLIYDHSTGQYLNITNLQLFKHYDPITCSWSNALGFIPKPSLDMKSEGWIHIITDLKDDAMRRESELYTNQTFKWFELHGTIAYLSYGNTIMVRNIEADRTLKENKGKTLELAFTNVGDSSEVSLKDIVETYSRNRRHNVGGTGIVLNLTRE